MLAVKGQNAIDVDFTDGGYITISQSSITYGKEVTVFVSIENVYKLIAAIKMVQRELKDR